MKIRIDDRSYKCGGSKRENCCYTHTTPRDLGLNNKHRRHVSVLSGIQNKADFFRRAASMNMTGNETVAAAQTLGRSWE